MAEQQESFAFAAKKAGRSLPRRGDARSPRGRGRAAAGSATRRPERRATPKAARAGATAADLARQQREISVSEFFTKNRHLLGFDNPSKALLTTVKEAVDNSLDACEEAGILPELRVEIHQLAEDRFRVAVEDNGPGIVRSQIPKIFGKLLYGSKFHRLNQSARPAGDRHLRRGDVRPAHHRQAGRDHLADREEQARALLRDRDRHARRTSREILKERRGRVGARARHAGRDRARGRPTRRAGTRSTTTCEQIGDRQPARPDRLRAAGPETSGPLVFERVTRRAAAASRRRSSRIRYGVELGVLIKMLKDTQGAEPVGAASSSEFSRVTGRVAEEICRAGAACDRATRAAQAARATRPSGSSRAIQETKIMAPPTNCLSPIGEELLLRGRCSSDVQADFYTAVDAARRRSIAATRSRSRSGSPTAASSRPTSRSQLLPLRQPRAAAVPAVGLRHHQGGDRRSTGRSYEPAAAAGRAADRSRWSCSCTSPRSGCRSPPRPRRRSPTIRRSSRRSGSALLECGRRLALHIGRRRRDADEGKKRSYIEKYIPHIGIALQEILGLSDAERERTVEDADRRARAEPEGGGEAGPSRPRAEGRTGRPWTPKSRERGEPPAEPGSTADRRT